MKPLSHAVQWTGNVGHLHRNISSGRVCICRHPPAEIYASRLGCNPSLLYHLLKLVWTYEFILATYDRVIIEENYTTNTVLTLSFVFVLGELYMTDVIGELRWQMLHIILTSVCQFANRKLFPLNMQLKIYQIWRKGHSYLIRRTSIRIPDMPQFYQATW